MKNERLIAAVLYEHTALSYPGRPFDSYAEN